MLYEVETAAATKKQETELEVTELQMRPCSLDLKMGRIPNSKIRGTANVTWLGANEGDARLRWFGYVMRREEE